MKNIMEIRPYADGDMAFVRQNPFQDAVKDYPDLPIPANTYTCEFNGTIVAVGGIKLFFEGVGGGWVLMTKQSRKDGIFGLIACRAIKDKLDSLAIELKMRRVEAQVRQDFPGGIRFVEALGFANPYERRFYFPDGTSSLLYEKLYNERS